MFRLIQAELVRYFRSFFFWAGVAVSMIFGIINGIQAWYEFYNFSDEISSSLFVACPLEDEWLYCAIWVLTVVISLVVGQEFSYGTIRSKFTVGHTRASVFLAETVVVFVVTLCVFAAFIIPVIIGGRYFFAAIRFSCVFGLLVSIFLVFFVIGLIAEAVVFLIANRSIGVVAAFSIMLLLAIVNTNLRSFYYNEDPEEIVNIYVEHTADGTPYAVEETEKNRFYVEGFSKALVTIEHEINPFSRMYNSCSAIWIQYPDRAAKDDLSFERQELRQLLCDCLILFIMSMIISGAGLMLFCKKDLK